MRSWEQHSWGAGICPEEVIATVGRLVARRVEQLVPPSGSVLVLAGRGNNGEDAVQAARNIQAREVHLLRVEDPQTVLPTLRSALDRRPNLVVDGLFGIGLNRPLDAAWLDVIRAINAASSLKISIDIPSGLDADSGRPQPECVEARWTLAVGAVKAGLLKRSATKWVGRIELLDEVGLCREVPRSDLEVSVDSDFNNYPPGRPEDAHKGSLGHLAVVAGSMGYHGAGVLAVQGASRARPGLMTLFTHPESYQASAAHLVGAMVSPWRQGFFDDRRFTALLIGPGLAAASGMEIPRALLLDAWRTLERPLVVDASALDWLHPRGVLASSARILTPHPGEAGRLLGVDADPILEDRVAAVRQISSRFGGAWVVLKGSRTLVGTAEGSIRVNLTGNPGLAQGGSGDLLAGFIAGLAAQPALTADVGKLLAYAVWAHGKAADTLETSRRNWTVEDLSELLGA